MKSLLAFLALASSTNAYHLSLIGKRQAPEYPTLRRRAAIAGTSGLSDALDIQYTTNITLGGLPFSVLIDTGSSDLWVASAVPVPGATDTGATSGVQYAVGEVQGPIELGALEFAGYTVPHQAFLFVTPDNANADGSGLIGLGPSAGSNIFQTLNTTAGNPPLDSIFLQDTSTPNFLTILLGRADEPTNPFPGDLTVGEILPGYEAIAQQPHLPVSTVSIAQTGDQHWQVLLDPNGALGPDGQPIPLTSVVQSSNPNQATVVFDSGFSLPQVPKSLADAYYSSFQGAEFVNITGLGDAWIVPCTAEVNISFKFGGNTFLVHPLDATLEPESLGLGALQNSQGTNACVGSFQPVSFDSQGLFDIILGMAFLRNSYLLVNFGDFIQGSTNKAAPFVQLLSTTNDSAEAHADFVQVRITNGSALDPSNHQSSFNNSGDGGLPSVRNKYTYIAVAAAAAALSLIILGVVLCVRSRNASRRAASKAWGSYAPLSAPAPAPAMEMQMHPPPPSWDHRPPYNQPYSEPWGPRY